MKVFNITAKSTNESSETDIFRYPDSDSQRYQPATSLKTGGIKTLTETQF